MGSSNHLILTVEDDAIAWNSLREMLAGGGYQVAHARGGSQALSLVETVRPDLVLMDLNLPDCSGFELLPRLLLRTGPPRVPVVACSNFLSEIDENLVASSGFTGLLLKPVDREILMAAVQAYLRPALQAPPIRRLPILVVDDVEVSLKLLSHGLEQAGFSVLQARDGREALDLLKKTQVCAVVSDSLMPVVDGFRLCHEVRSHPLLRHLPLILHSEAYDEEEDRQLAHEAGADAFVVRRGSAFQEVTEALMMALEAPQRPAAQEQRVLASRHVQRLTNQLARQHALNAQLTRRCAIQSAALSSLEKMAEYACAAAAEEYSSRDILATCIEAIGAARAVIYRADGSHLRWHAQVGFPDPRPLEDFFGQMERLEEVRRRGKPLLLPHPGEVDASLQAVLQACGCRLLMLVPLGQPSALLEGVLVTMHLDIQPDALLAPARAVGQQLAHALALTSAMSQVAHSERRFRLLLESTGEGIVGVDEKGHCTFVNPAAASMLGYQQEELVGQELRKLICGEDGGHERELGRQASQRRLRRLDGSFFQADIAATSMPQGGAVIAFRDVTERNRLEEQVRESQKMDSLGILAGGVAHDFNNLLTTIGGYTELLLKQLGKDTSSYEFAQEIAAASQRAETLTRQLLAFSRKQVTETTHLEVNYVIANIEKMLRRTIGEDITLTTRLQPSLPIIVANTGHLEQIILNLAVNARDAMPRGGTLSITTFQSGGQVVMEVSDSGCGMDADTQKKVFEPFFTTKELGRGTGLGLSTVYGIVKQHGGTIALESAPGEGTTFRIAFPAQESPPQSPAAARSQPAANSNEGRGGATILLVEDDQFVRSLARHILSGSGYTLLECGNGLEALDTFRHRAAEVDLVLTDTIMPKMSGLELAEKIRQLKPDAKVLFMSGYTDDALQRHGLDLGLGFVAKPFTPQSLLQSVRAALQGVTR